MKRRESLKALSLGSLGMAVVPANAMAPAPKKSKDDYQPAPGRTDEEIKRDKALHEQTFFDKHELETLAVLCNIIVPKDEKSGNATDAGVPDFIEFIAKDMPRYQLPLRGGIKWLDNYSDKLHEKKFKALSDKQQLAIAEKLAYPEEATPEVSQGVAFFSTVRDLTLTGFYTTKMGFDDLEYKGNTPNFWDGVPQDVLDKYGFEYDPLYFKSDE
ncbi:gluconate 2-dehydrogenase subunit 3 family protein [Jiulongibacter sp. NS-SX5]|uniref:gluconate 2-dehydrogenase subunit 3 family protein n=1 Tax=Jiulongibacter sp. NS-SX5 TaxID=3463854 RepID=UPI00405925DD